MKRQLLKGLTASALVLSLTGNLAIAQDVADENFAGGVINITGSAYDPTTNTATSTALVNQVFKGTSLQIVPSSSSIIGSVTNDPAFTAVNDEQFFPTSFAVRRNYSSASLTCSEPEDHCRGCFYNIFQGVRRTDNLVNAADRIFRVITQHNVKGTVLPPQYYGKLWLDFEPGKQNSIDLMQFIRASRPIACSLRAPNPLGSGIDVNPKAGDHSLQVSSSCKVLWDTSDAQVGQQYAFQMIIQETGGHFCPGYTEVDMVAQIGCAAGDLTCLQCSNIDVNAIYASAKNALANQFKLEKKLLRLSNKAAKRLSPGSQSLFQRELRKRRKQLKAAVVARIAAIDEALITQPKLIQSCQRPSNLFCQSIDVSTTVAPIIKAAAETQTESIELNKKMFKITKTIGEKNVVRKKFKRLDKIQKLARATENSVSPLKGTVSQCQLN